MAYKNKEDQKKAARRHYEANKEKMVARAKEYTSNQRLKIRRRILEHLQANPCVNCGEDDPIVLEFDHLDHLDPSSKSFAIADSPNRGHSISRLNEEIAKCQVLCANCHRRKTYVERNFSNKNVDT